MKTAQEISDEAIDFTKAAMADADARQVLGALLGCAAHVAQAIRSTKVLSVNDIQGMFQTAMDHAFTPPATVPKVRYGSDDDGSRQ